jgi:hypothetical protein
LVDRGLLDVLSNLTLVTVVLSESSVPVSNLLVEIELVVIGIAGHQLRLAQRKLVALVRLPKVVDLAVQSDDFFHLLVLGNFPDSFGDTSGARHEEHARLDFKDVRVPEFALFVVQGFVEAGTNHVFDTDETSI